MSYATTSHGPAFQYKSNMNDRPNFVQETILMRRVVRTLSLLFFNLIAAVRLLMSIDYWDAVILDIESVPAALPIILIRQLRIRTPALVLRITTNPVELEGKPPGFWRYVLYAIGIKLAAEYFDRLLFISPMLGRLYSHELGVPKSKIGVWPANVDLDIFDPSIDMNTQSLRNEIGLLDRPGFLYHGVISRGRGTKELVDAFRLLKEDGLRVALVLLGYGSQREEISRYVRDNHLEDVVKIHEPVAYSEVPSFISACDAGIVPLPDHVWWRYQCPIKVLEYLAMNRPVIVSDIPAHRWIIGKSNVAIYLAGTGSREIADGIREYLMSKNRLDPSLGRGIAANFSATATSRMLEHEICVLKR